MTSPPYDIAHVRTDFPILERTIYNKPLIYLDNAATVQKPRSVVEAMAQVYYDVNANVHRGVHYLSQQATELHEAARRRVQTFINAAETAEIVFTRGTTESINLVASSFAATFMKPGDEVLVSEMEHHANIVPWQLEAERRGIVLRVIPITDDGQLDLAAFEHLLNARTRLVSLCHVSNVLGTVNPVKAIIDKAHAMGAAVLVDGAQSVPHFAVDVQALDADFYVFSAHKMYGPTGIGVLYGKRTYLDRMPPYQGGGAMIGRVSFEKTTWERLPFKFEAGTPDYVAAHGLACAIDYIEQLGLARIQQHEQALLTRLTEGLSAIPNVTIYGTAPHKDAVVSFTVGHIHPLDLGTLLDRLGIAIRTGHHCAQPLMQRYGVESMLRASLGLYNTAEEVDTFIAALKRVIAMF
ncbi:MAG: cysteine desulfurase [Bacteroidales bacterium]|nr:cysteine desulfurase [Bacteroidales bacterium]